MMQTVRFKIPPNAGLRPSRSALKVCLSALFGLMLLSSATFAQEFTVTGKLTSGEDGAGLPGVSILEKGTTNGTTSDSDGVYVIRLSGSQAILSFSFIGYITQEVTVNSKNMIDIILIADITQLAEVVVVGYGAVKKSDLTGSISSVKSEQLTAYPAINAEQALQGRAAGVQIQSNNGAPGSDFKIRIRGASSINASSDPIFVIDGFVGGVLPPPEDIQSIEVLKDASATAIYGSRAANGVILVTTKKGKTGTTNIQFNSSYSFQEEISRLDLLNGEQFTDYITEINPAYVSSGENTDWQDEIFRPGAIQNYSLSASGGTEAARYYVGVTSFDQKGIIKGSDYGRFSVTSNLDFTASKRLNIGLNMFAQRESQNGTITQEGSGGINNTGVISSSYKFMPDQGIYEPGGSYTTALVGDPTDNPVAVANEYQNESLTDRFQGNVYGEFKILESLKFRTSFGATVNNGRTGIFIPTTLNQGRNVGGQGSINATKRTNFINENYLTYTTSFGTDHSLTVLGGYSLQKFSNESWGATSQSFITDAVSFWNLNGGAIAQPPNSFFSESVISSYYTRLNYSYKGKYLLTLNARSDGSSNFSKNNKQAFFPSGAVAWNMGSENFMTNIPIISFWKWRASYGLTGNQAISPYGSLARFGTVYTVINGVPVNAVRPTSVANNNLTWETAAQFDIGADIGLWNDRLTITVDYYNRVTSDLLFALPLPQYSGFGGVLSNVGKVENKGFEFSFASRNLVGEFKWNSDFNISFNENKVLELPGGNDVFTGSRPGHLIGISSSTQILREGYPVGSFWGFEYDGVYQANDTFIPGAGFEQTAGGEKFRDVSEDGNLNSADQTIIGNPNPKFIWGFSNDFSWKNFDLNIFFQASQGNDILSYTLLELETMSGFNNSTTRALDRWTPTNTDTDVPRASGRPQRVSSRWVYDGSFVRLKNIALGYTLPAALVEKMAIQKLRVYVSAQNILTFTDYPGIDPEVNYSSGGSGSGSNQNLGLDYGSYPNAKSFTVGLSIGF